MTAVLATISDAFSSYHDRKNRGAASGGRRRGRRAIGLMLIAQLVLLTGIVPQALAQDGIADPAGANSIAADVGTTTALTLAPSSINQSQSATLTATVKSDKSGTPVVTGTVDFCRAGAKACAGSDRIGTAQLVNGAASIVIFADPGQHSYTAMFRGGPGYTASASTSQTLTASRTSLYPTTAAIGTVNSAPPYTIPVTVTGLGVLPGLAPNGVADILDTSNNDYRLAITPSMSNAAYGIAAASTTLTVGNFSYSMASEDFNKDGRADLAVANQGDNNVQIFLAQSDGTFPATPSSTILDINQPNPIVAGDFNNDGYVDLAVGATSNISVFTGKEHGGFETTPINTAANGFVAFAVRDFDLNGALDIAVVTAGNSQVYLGDGKGHFPTKGSPAPVGSNPGATGASVGSTAAGDFNNDGKPDLVVPQTPSDKVSVLLGDGLGSFQPDPTQISTGTDANAMSVAVADFDGDGNLDFAVGVNNPNGPGYVIPYKGDPTGKIFTKKTPYSIGGTIWNTITVAVGDFNADGKPDIAIAYFAGSFNVNMQLLLGSGTWTFTQGATIQPGSWPGVPVTGDFNGDGFTDVAVANAFNNDVTVGMVQPSVTVTATTTDVPAPAGDPSAADHQVVAVYEGDMKFTRSPQSAPVKLAPQKIDTILTVTADPQGSSNAGQAVTLTATFGTKNSQDAQGHTPNGDWVTFTTDNGNVFLGKAQFALDSKTNQYVATLPNVTHLPSGKITVTASYPGDAYFNSTTGSIPYTVGPRAPVKVALALEPAQAQVPAGTQVTLTATMTPAVSGTVYFCKKAAPCIGVNRLGEAQLTGGKAAMSFYPGIGTYIFQARFAGTITDAAGISNTEPLTVIGEYPTTTAIGKPDGNGPYNIPVTVTGIAPSPLAPTGTVEIIDHTSGITLGSVNPGNPTYDVAETTVAVAAGKGPYSSTAGDFNADGIEDIAVANRDDKSIGVYLGTHDGKFQLPPISWATDGNPYPIEAGDFDNNGTLDLAVGNGSNLTVFKNPGTGHFNGHVDTGGVSDFQSLVPGDFDNDGNLDVVVVHRSSQQVYLGNGQNGFSPAPAGAFAPGSLPPAYYRSAAGDFNKDGNLDLVISDGQWNSNIWVLLGDGQGGFQPDPSKYSVQSERRFASSVAVADFNGDGNLDFAAGVYDWDYSQSSSIFVYQGGTDGKTFTQKATVPLTGGHWGNGNSVHVSVAVGDFNADGIADLVAAGSDDQYKGGSAQVGAWLGDGNWNFTPSTQFSPGTNSLPAAFPLSAIVGDFNGDGFTDVSAVNATGNSAAVGFLQPTTTVTGTAQNVPAPVGTGTHDVWADYDGDSEGNFAPSASGTVPLAAKKLDTTLGLIAMPGPPVAAPRKVALSASLDTGKQDLQGHAPSGEVTFSIVNGEQLGTAPFELMNGGSYMANLPAQTLPTGSYTVQATYPGDGNFNTPQPITMPFTVTGTTTTLKITPDTVDQGKPTTLTATVTDGKTAITSGTVDFCRSGVEACAGSDRIGSAQIANGEAKVVIFADVGLHSYTARFRGITDSPGSRSTSQTLTVTPTSLYPTTTVIGKVEGTGPYNLPVTVTGFGTPPAQVRPGTPAGQAPTGDVTILDKTNNNAKLGSATLTQPPVYGVADTTATLTAGKGPYSLAGADFNDDGLLDLAVANRTDNNIQIFLAQSDGKFPATPSWTISNVTGALPIVAADFTNDGYIDLAVGATSNISVFTGKGKDGFNPTPFDTAASDIVSFAVSDFDASGTLDLALVTSTSSQIWLGDGAGKFTAKGSPVPPGNAMKNYGANAAAGDFNNDEIPDLLVPQGSGSGSKVWVLLGDGTGLFQTNPKQIETVAGATVQAVAVADFDQDGNLDFTVGVENYNSDSLVAFYQGQGDGKNFTAKPAVTFAGTSWHNVNVTVGDFNADGLADAAAIYFQNDSGTIQILLGSSSSPWTFTPGTTLQVGEFPMSPVVGDFNGDGFADVAVANARSNSVSVATVQPTTAVTATVNNVMAVGNPASGKHDVFASYAGDKQFKASDSSANPTPIAPQQLGTGLKLTADPSGTSLVGQEVELTATLTFKGDPQSHSVENEKVTFTADTTPLGTAELHLVAGSNPVAYVAKLVTTALPAGKSTIKADYGGDQNFTGSSDTLPYNVTGTQPEVDLVVSTGGNANVGDTVTLTATVKSGGTVVQMGTVDFCYTASTPLCTDINRIGSAQIFNGTATVSFTPYAGTYELRADFAGFDSYGQSRSQPQKLVVLGKYPTQTTITPPKRSGNNDTYDVKVTGTAPQSLKTPPAGNVQIQDMSNLFNGNPYALGENTGSNPLANPQLAIANAPQTLIGGGGADSAATADFDGNGIRDVVIALKNDQKLIVIMNGGPTYSRIFTDGNPYPVATGDFNNDALPDIVIGNSTKLTFYPGTGSPTGPLGPPKDTPTAIMGSFSAFAVRDFNRDGKLDLAVVGSYNTQIYLGDGSGKFTAAGNPVPYGNDSTEAVSVDTGDFNNDELPDLILTNNYRTQVWVLFGAGDGTFQPNPISIRPGRVFTQTVAAADFDKDGNLDFAVGISNPLSNSSVQVYQGNGIDKSFSPQPKFDTKHAPSYASVSVIAGDFNADGYADLAMADYVVSGSNPDVQIWTGNGNFVFTKADVPITPQPGPRAPVTGDFNGDGYADLFVPGSNANQTTAAFLSPTVTVSTSLEALVPIGDPGGAKHDIVGAYLGDSNFAADTSTT
ncbi:FG-GAP-like repeat-containing protein, partial [Phyllobacterium leguminum]